MRTNFTDQQLADPRLASAESIIRRCVHCGLCTSSCPTYTLLGDERDSPRGRIYLIKDMLEGGGPANATVTRHMDRCLSCFACVTVCPSGVDYMHLSDIARAHIEETGKRSPKRKLMRRILAASLPDPTRFRVSLLMGKLLSPFAPLLTRLRLQELGAMLRLAGRQGAIGMPKSYAEVIPAEGRRKKRVALLLGCAQRSLRPAINDATLRLLARHGVEVVLPRGLECCGALQHHLGQEAGAMKRAKQNVDVWSVVMRQTPLDAILVNTSGCGTVVKDYGHLLGRDKGYSERAEAIAKIAKDVTEFMADIGLRAPEMWSDVRVAYHAACSLQHGQRVTEQPRALLRQAGFTVVEPAEGHLCCGSAGTYNVLQPEIAEQLRARKLGNIRATEPDVVATGNVGCMTQLGGEGIPLVHTVELLDWATGGPVPPGMEAMESRSTSVRSLTQAAAE